ncbi:MAG: protease SohB, partial [Pseudomonadota bacterium]|nr:protease SohB [Pseudomonadota bacterium]
MTEWLAEMGTFLLQTILVMAAAGILLVMMRRNKESSEHGLKLYVESLDYKTPARNPRPPLTTKLQGARKNQGKAHRHQD